MQQTPSTPNQRKPKRVRLVSGGATNTSPKKTKTGKSAVFQSQAHALKDSTKRRKNRLNASVNNDAKQPIDLTGDDTDTQTEGKNLDAINSHHPVTRTAIISKGASRRPRHLPTPALSVKSTNSQNTMTDDDDSVGTSGHQVSASERSTKRARCEDATDTVDTGMKVMYAEQYHVAPPRCPTISPDSMNTTQDLRLPPKPARNDTSAQNPTNTNPCFRPAASPSRLAANTEHTFVTNPDPPHKPAESILSARNEGSLTQAETTAMPNTKHDVKTEHHTTQQDSASPPSLPVKIKLAREFSQALAVPERHAYQLLMSHGWVVDDAVLAHMGAKVDSENAEDGKAKAEEKITEN